MLLSSNNKFKEIVIPPQSSPPQGLVLHPRDLFATQGTCSPPLICIFEFLAQPSPALWNISAYSTGDSGIALDWYGYPSNLEIAFFILSVNQTTISPFFDDHDDDDRKLLRFLRTFNSSQSTYTIKELPPATEFTAVVYIIGKNNEIIKSERRTFATEERGTRFLFYFLTILTMQLR